MLLFHGFHPWPSSSSVYTESSFQCLDDGFGSLGPSSVFGVAGVRNSACVAVTPFMKQPTETGCVQSVGAWALLYSSAYVGSVEGVGTQGAERQAEGKRPGHSWGVRGGIAECLHWCGLEVTSAAVLPPVCVISWKINIATEMWVCPEIGQGGTPPLSVVTRREGEESARSRSFRGGAG